MTNIGCYTRAAIMVLGATVVGSTCALAQTPPPCSRPATGSIVTEPDNLFSSNGVLSLAFNYFTQTDSDGRSLYCFVTPSGSESPTLHVNPGDTLMIAETNQVPAPPPGSPTSIVSTPQNQCGDSTMTITSLNFHFHGQNVSPQCHGDQVIHTIINSGETFNYSVTFPRDEPPGLYWYHTHVHGLAEATVQGGASGAVVVDGIEKLQPAVAGLPERILFVRDQIVAGQPTPGGAVPSWDVTLNYVPIAYPAEVPAIIQMKPGKKEFWRVANASADSLYDVQLLYDGVPQPLQVVALDGVPIGSQDGTGQGTLSTQTDIFLATAARAEFIVSPPPPGVTATFVTLNVNTGPGGDNDPTRTLATIQLSNSPVPKLPVIPQPSGPPNPQRFAGLATVKPTAQRTLFFSEVLSDPSNPASPTNFFITVDGATPTLFDPLNPPAIITHQGAVEDWTIENQAMENHEFHMHQIHFLVLAQNNEAPIPVDQGQYLDMIQVPFWSGTGPYPSVKVRMDFRGMDVGDFVYHCHILGHEDAGMMAIIRVLPPSS